MTKRNEMQYQKEKRQSDTAGQFDNYLQQDD